MNPMSSGSLMQGNASGLSNKTPRGYSAGRLQNYTPEQMQLFQSLFSHLNSGSYLSKLSQGDPSLFAEMEQPALRQFGELQSDIANRFSGRGMGSRGSGFFNAQNTAASQFSQDLQSRRQQLQQEAIKSLLGMGNELLGQKPYEQLFVKNRPSFWEGLSGGLGNLFGRAPSAFTQSFMGG